MRGREALLLLPLLFLLLLAAGKTFSTSDTKEKAINKPHIIFMLADDLGWYDVSWNNPKALSPNLEELGKQGIFLNQSYVQPICTPTRAALMTSRYPYTIGRQHEALLPEQPTGLTFKREILPQAMKKAGYSTHLIGKWHLGFCSWNYTPTSRGFDTFYGYYGDDEDYYNKTRKSEIDPEIVVGYDFRNNTEVDRSVFGEYSTDVYASAVEQLLESRDPNDPMFLYLAFQSVHFPLEVPDDYAKPFSYIEDEGRQTKLGMVLAMDEAVGRVMKTLKDTGHYNNSVIIFSSDNGGSTRTQSNNWPLRGNKTTLWEGGTRGPAFVHSSLLKNKGSVSNELIHVTDWFPTLVGLAGGSAPDDIDGFDQWESISTGSASPRTQMIYNIDIPEKEMNAGIRKGDFKLLVGDPGPGEWIFPPEDQNGTKILLEVTTESDADIPEGVTTVGQLGLDVSQYSAIREFITNDTNVQLYNLIGDPEERDNVALDNKDIVDSLMSLLNTYAKDYVEADEPPNDPAGSAANFDYVWSPGWCEPK